MFEGLKNLFGRKADPKTPKRTPAPRPLPNPPAAAAKRISDDGVRAWTERLEREGRRTGNQRLIRQAESIRARLGA